MRELQKNDLDWGTTQWGTTQWGSLLSVSVEVDAKNSSWRALTLAQPELGLDKKYLDQVCIY